MQALCSAVALLGISCTNEADVQLTFDFHNHLSKYGLSYGTDDEYRFRFEQFKANDAKIKAINAKNASYTVSHNKFSTYTQEEFQKLLGKKPTPIGEEAPVEFLDVTNTPKSVDWREKGAVNPVQDQGQCGSCWAFSSTAAMESEHFIKTGKLLKLSEQQFVDCDPQSDGCGGGLEIWAFQYAKQNPLELETDYPYTAYTGTCASKKKKEIVEAEKYYSVPKRSVEQLKAAVAKQPTCVSVDAETDFQFYSGGILDVSDCGTQLDHAVTAVGYGYCEEKKKEYLIVRNSWGPDWGEDGYIRLALDKDGDGVCGVLLDSNRPITN